MRPCAEPRKLEIMITIKCDCRENSFRNNGEAKRMVPSLLNLLSERKSRTHIFFIPCSGVVLTQMWFEMSRVFCLVFLSRFLVFCCEKITKPLLNVKGKIEMEISFFFCDACWRRQKNLHIRRIRTRWKSVIKKSSLCCKFYINFFVLIQSGNLHVRRGNSMNIHLIHCRSCLYFSLCG